MASLYTDEALEARYARNRKKKRLYELVSLLLFLMWLACALFVMLPDVIIGVLSVVANIMSLLTTGELDSDMTNFIVTALVELATALPTGYVIYRKRSRYALILSAVLFVLMLTTRYYAFVSFQLFLNIMAFILHRCWETLAQEEGYPLFAISYQEQQEKQQAAERLAKKQAIKAAQDACAEQPVSNAAAENVMPDLLDPQTVNIPSDLAGYHDRFQQTNADTEHEADAITAPM